LDSRPGRKADLLLLNARVLTPEVGILQADSVAVAGGRIIGMGQRSEVENLRGRGTKLLDCQGRTLAPGFQDAHVHLLSLASSLISLDLSPSSVSSISDIQQKVREKASRCPEGTWIRGSGYNEFYLKERRHPNRWDLDKAAQRHPVKLVHRTGLACVLNSLALSLVGITRETPDPPGGLIERDEAGEPTGVLFGMDRYLEDRIPRLKWEDLRRGLKLAEQLLLSLGITAVHEATVHNDLPRWQTFQRMKEEGCFKPRIIFMPGWESLSEFINEGLRPGRGDEELRLGPVKLVMSRTRSVLEPMLEELSQQILFIHRSGFQAAIHAVEEEEVEAAVTALERAQQLFPRPEPRHRLEHCSECPPRLAERLKRVGAVVVSHPAFVYYNGDKYLAEVSRSKLPWLYPFRLLWENGLKLAAGSDSPGVPPDPFSSIYSAVTRRTRSGQLLSPEQAIPIRQAILMHTLGGAYAVFEEGDRGSIAVGKLADLVILSANPLEVPNEDLKRIQVEKTILAGKVVWEREN